MCVCICVCVCVCVCITYIACMTLNTNVRLSMNDWKMVWRVPKRVSSQIGIHETLETGVKEEGERIHCHNETSK